MELPAFTEDDELRELLRSADVADDQLAADCYEVTVGDDGDIDVEENHLGVESSHHCVRCGKRVSMTVDELEDGDSTPDADTAGPS